MHMPQRPRRRIVVLRGERVIERGALETDADTPAILRTKARNKARKSDINSPGPNLSGAQHRPSGRSFQPDRP
jgi:hypothetical protein